MIVVSNCIDAEGRHESICVCYDQLRIVGGCTPETHANSILVAGHDLNVYVSASGVGFMISCNVRNNDHMTNTVNGVNFGKPSSPAVTTLRREAEAFRPLPLILDVVLILGRDYIVVAVDVSIEVDVIEWAQVIRRQFLRGTCTRLT